MDDETLQLYKEALSCLSQEDAARLISALWEIECGFRDAMIDDDGWQP